jgi:peroxiredoxin
MIQVGQEAPAFRLPGAAAGRFDEHALSEYTDRGWTVVLVFYPFDFHPACTDQWCSFRDAEWLTILDDVVVLGIGADGVYAHGEYATQHDLQFTLLADTDGRVARAYGVLADEFEGHREVPERATFVIDPDRVVRFAWSADGPDDQPDMEALRRATGGRHGESSVEGIDGPN